MELSEALQRAVSAARGGAISAFFPSSLRETGELIAWAEAKEMGKGLTEKKKKYATMPMASKGIAMMMAFFKFVVIHCILRQDLSKNSKLDLLNCVKVANLVLLACVVYKLQVDN